MFDNRWDNWSGDFAESFGSGLLDPAVRDFVPEILAQLGLSVRKLDPGFPDEVPEVIARFLEYLQESGRVGEGSDWAAQVRVIALSYRDRLKPEGGVKGVTIRKPVDASPVGRNDPCPCGSGKKYKKCCHARA